VVVNFTAAAEPRGRARSSDTAAAVLPERLQAPEMEMRAKDELSCDLIRVAARHANLLDFAP
jgi:hypothetical protein